MKHPNPTVTEKSDADSDVSAAAAKSTAKKMTVDNEGMLSILFCVRLLQLLYYFCTYIW